MFAFKIQAVARKEFKSGDTASSDSSSRVSDIPITAFGSRAHLEEKALATVQYCLCFLLLYLFFYSYLS